MSVFSMKPPSPPLLSKLLNAVNYVYHDLWDEIGDPRVKQYHLFSGGPWTVVAIVAFYLYFVLNLGPAFVKNRKPFEIRRFTFVYNVCMVIFNGWMCLVGMSITNYGLDAWGCQLVDKTSTNYNETMKLFVGYWFFCSKLIELSDTVIFILRKKWNQVSVLHVIHHSLVPLLIWTGYKISPGGNMALFPLLNSAIHTVMYTYYGLSTFPNVQKYLWWKKYLTTAQMVQFVIVMVHSLHVLVLPGCHFPKVLLYLSLSNALLFLVLFYSFFRRAYGTMRRNSSRVGSEGEVALTNGKCRLSPNCAISSDKIGILNDEEEDILITNNNLNNGNVKKTN